MHTVSNYVDIYSQIHPFMHHTNILVNIEHIVYIFLKIRYVISQLLTVGMATCTFLRFSSGVFRYNNDHNCFIDFNNQ